MATGADALPYPDDDPAAIRGFARALGGRSEAMSGAIGTVRGGRDALAARWQGLAGPAAVAEVDAVAALGDRATAALADAQAPLDDYATALDDARAEIDALRVRYDQAEADHRAALDSLDGTELAGPGLRLFRMDADDARSGQQSAIRVEYDEVIAGLKTAATTAGGALTDIAGRISPSPESLDGSLARADALAALPMMRRIDVLARQHHIDPEIAALVLLAEAGHPVTGDVAVAVLLAEFGRFDNAGEGGDRDGVVSRKDLRAIAEGPNLPAHVRAAARYLLDNEELFDLVETADDRGGPMDRNGRATAADVAAFLVTNRHLRALHPYATRLDTAGRGGDPDGRISRRDLEAAAADPALPQGVRDAARYLLDHQPAFRSLSDHTLTDSYGGGFHVDELIGRLVDGQAHVHDPAAAMRFTMSLPVATNGGHGLPIDLVGDDGVRALANSALIGAGGDLTDSQQVISHLPETEGAVRNQLITGYYDMLAGRVEGIFAGAAGAQPGNPLDPNHPGASWLNFGPWASNSVRGAIDGSQLGGLPLPMSVRQGAADGNQWIFDDVTQPFAAFVELYERTGGQPTTADLQGFFDTTFGPGEEQIRRGFQAYVAATLEDDAARRQQLMFQGNTLVAIHEQAGAEPYLDAVSFGPDSIATAFVDPTVAGREFDVDRDLPFLANGNNLVDDAPILDLDPMRLTHDDLSGNGVTFASGGTRGGPGVVLADIGGWEERQPGLALSSHEWYEQEGQAVEYRQVGRHVVAVPVRVDPDRSLAGTAAGSWADYEDRMWHIHRMFEQMHTSPELFDTRPIDEEIDNRYLTGAVPLDLTGR